MSSSALPVSHEEIEQLKSETTRREFMRLVGVGSVLAFLPGFLVDCTSDTIAGPSGVTLNFSSDAGVLNYAYALEQLEAAFYVQVSATPYTNMPANELAVFTDLKLHERIHRDFLKAALGAKAIGTLSPNFSSIDFTSRKSVLTAAVAFEDTGVSAYNGAGHYLKSAAYLTIAGKIVSVEARHAAAIRDLFNPRSTAFAGDDVVDPTTGLDAIRTPTQVLGTGGAATAFVKNKITISNS